MRARSFRWVLGVLAGVLVGGCAAGIALTRDRIQDPAQRRGAGPDPGLAAGQLRGTGGGSGGRGGIGRMTGTLFLQGYPQVPIPAGG